MRAGPGNPEQLRFQKCVRCGHLRVWLNEWGHRGWVHFHTHPGEPVENPPPNWRRPIREVGQQIPPRPPVPPSGLWPEYILAAAGSNGVFNSNRPDPHTWGGIPWPPPPAPLFHLYQPTFTVPPEDDATWPVESHSNYSGLTGPNRGWGVPYWGGLVESDEYDNNQNWGPGGWGN